jgi:hypothetical protein
MGAAVASLAAFHFATWFEKTDGPIERLHLTSFGCPRVGNKPWVQVC